MKNFLMATRPKTLVAAIIPPIVAHSLYVAMNGESATYWLTLCILVALFLQLATNFYNDAIDFAKGADANRVGPKRVTAGKLSSYNTVMRWGHLALILASLVAIPLAAQAGWPVIILGLMSLYLAYGYTGGPYPLAYKGLGEIFVFLFFGLVATVGTYYIMSGQAPLGAWVLGSEVGLLSCVLIAVNNFRDRKEDIKVNKRTLATKMSDSSYLLMMDFFLFAPYFLNLYFFFKYKMSYIFVLLAMPIAHKVRMVLHEHKSPEELNQALKFAGIHLMMFGILFVMGALWQA
jgi:1,4-dihydroxy-2-naphthoate octaprenyltransferase